jgi:hypothetical protein
MSAIYEICIEGQLDPCWSEWLDGIAITSLEDGNTLLCSSLADQASLHGLLNRIRDMNLKLISIERKNDQPPT